MQPRDRTLHHPASFAQFATVGSATPGKLSRHSAFSEPLTQAFGIVGAVSLNQAWFASWCACLATNAGHRVKQRLYLGHVMTVRLGQNDRQRDTLGIRENVVFAARTRAIGWVRSTFFPAPWARMEELSTMAQEKSSLSAPLNWLSSTWCSRSHTRALCHALRRRQQVMPDPQPSSLGSISQGMPERETNRMPFNTLRLHNGSLPVCRLRRRFFGKSGSICDYSPSSTITCAIA